MTMKWESNLLITTMITDRIGSQKCCYQLIITVTILKSQLKTQFSSLLKVKNQVSRFKVWFSRSKCWVFIHLDLHFLRNWFNYLLLQQDNGKGQIAWHTSSFMTQTTVYICKYFISRLWIEAIHPPEAAIGVSWCRDWDNLYQLNWASWFFMLLTEVLNQQCCTCTVVIEYPVKTCICSTI